jgi:hypothetical protein
MDGLVPNLTLPLTNNFSFELVEPILTVSFEVSTNSVPLSTFNAVSVEPMLVQALALYTCCGELDLSTQISPAS